MSKTIGIYAGSFDPPTNGHVWMIEHAAKIVDGLIVAIGENPKKTTTYSKEQRVQWLLEINKSFNNTMVVSFTNQYLVHYAKGIGATHIVRGIRNYHDYVYEQDMRQINSDLVPDIGTIFLMPPAHLNKVSSSLVKGLIGPDDWQNIVKRYVPECVYASLRERV